MNCLTARKTLLPEPAGRSAAVGEHEKAKQHVADCRQCRLFFAQEEKFLKIVRTKLPVTPAPPRLREAILSSVAKEKQEEIIPGSSIFRRMPSWRTTLGAAALISVLIGVFLVSPWRQQDAGQPDLIINTLIQDHLTIKLKEHPLDLETSDKTQLRQWLAARVDFNVTIPDFQNAKLLGGHLCLIGGKRSASLSYEKDGVPFTHYMIDRGVIDLAPLKPFDSMSNMSVVHREAKGCNIVLWEEKGLVHGIVSDLSVQALLSLIHQPT